MSVREEDRGKSNSAGRGLGLAAAAIGVGVGAALYYFFNKSAENHPDTEGSTQNWQCDETLFRYMAYSASEDSDTNLSEHSISDISIVSSENDVIVQEDCLNNTDTDIDISINDSDESVVSVNSNVTSDESPNQINSSISDLSMDWDVTDSSLDVLNDQRELMSSPLRLFTTTRSRREQPSLLQQCEDAKRLQAFRERSWSLEECSICFDVILKDQEVMALPCTHQFHSKCIVPWLNQQQTCPNCRKAV